MLSLGAEAGFMSSRVRISYFDCEAWGLLQTQGGAARLTPLRGSALSSVNRRKPIIVQ